MSSSVIKNKNKIVESAREQTTKKTFRVKGLLWLWADKLAKQKADESLAVMCAYMNLDIKLKTT